MEKIAWTAKILPGKKEEYIRRHNEIWPEMLQVLKDAGIKNYSIWLEGDTLFGYYECIKGLEYAQKIQRESPVADRWNESMSGIMDMKMDKNTGAQPRMIQVFEF